MARWLNPGPWEINGDVCETFCVSPSRWNVPFLALVSFLLDGMWTWWLELKQPHVSQCGSLKDGERSSKLERAWVPVAPIPDLDHLIRHLKWEQNKQVSSLKHGCFCFFNSLQPNLILANTYTKIMKEPGTNLHHSSKDGRSIYAM